MKLVLFVAALTLSGAAFAQEVPQKEGTTADRVFTDPSGFRAEETPGGYQPAGSPFQSPPKPGEPVVFRPQTLTPTEAFPPPAPRAHYPRCKPKQYNNCTQLPK